MCHIPVFSFVPALLQKSFHMKFLELNNWISHETFNLFSVDGYKNSNSKKTVWKKYLYTVFWFWALTIFASLQLLKKQNMISVVSCLSDFQGADYLTARKFLFNFLYLISLDCYPSSYNEFDLNFIDKDLEKLVKHELSLSRT